MNISSSLKLRFTSLFFLSLAATTARADTVSRFWFSCDGPEVQVVTEPQDSKEVPSYLTFYLEGSITKPRPGKWGHVKGLSKYVPASRRECLSYATSLNSFLKPLDYAKLMVTKFRCDRMHVYANADSLPEKDLFLVEGKNDIYRQVSCNKLAEDFNDLVFNLPDVSKGER